MSLFSFLHKTDVRAQFKQEFPKPQLTSKVELLAPPLTKNYSTVGTTCDYLIRFKLKTLNPQAVERKWIAENSLSILQRFGLNHLYEQASLVITEARENYKNFLKSQIISDELIKSALLLGQLDVLYRLGKLDNNFPAIDLKDVEDLKALISQFDSSQFQVSGAVVLNPTFGIGSKLVRGADADFLLDDLLVDIKTIRKFQFSRDDFNQIMGYYTLSHIGGIDGVLTGHEIKRLGIYFSRHAYLFVFNVSDVVNPQTFPQFLQWFQQRAAINDY
jgi:hypothetical protein